jgi:hypothetical protein
MEHDFALINTNRSTNRTESHFTECYEMDGDFYIYTLFFEDKEKYVIANKKGQRVSLVFFKLNDIYYININRYITIDLKRFLHIEYIVTQETDGENIKIKTTYDQILILQNCDISLVHKMLKFIEKWYNNHCNWWYNLKYHMTN